MFDEMTDDMSRAKQKSFDIVNPKAGIVIVSHNASLAVRMTLASLRQAKNETPFELILVDNASRLIERDSIKKAFERHVREANLPWRMIQLSENRGFSGGNNIGIEAFMKDESVSHICLLNSDVIVSDFWLDRLIANNFDVVTPVTNKSDSTQSIPVDYQVKFFDSLDYERELLFPSVYNTVNKFAQRWFTAWQGNNFVTNDEITFFCVLLTRDIIQRVGLLDPTFFPGGYEDFDYCRRVRANRGKICLVRDVFIHHWGSASFGKISREDFNENAARNKKYLEEKHNLIWESHPQAPIISYRYDLLYSLKGKGELFHQKDIIELYQRILKRLLVNYTKEFERLLNELIQSGVDVPEGLTSHISQIQKQGDVVRDFSRLTDEIQALQRKLPAAPVVFVEIEHKLSEIEEKVKNVAFCNVMINQFLNERVRPAPGKTKYYGLSKLNQVINRLVRGFSFFIHLKGVVIFGGYPYPFRENDGYFQRIKAVDGLFPGRTRIYIDRVNLQNKKSWFDRPVPDVLVLNVTGGLPKKLVAAACAMLCIMRTHIVYFHSVLPLRKFSWVLHLPFIKKIVDLHGVVPEEFFYHNDEQNAQFYEKLEKTVVKKADYLIVVTKAMQHHIIQKYGKSISGQFISLPILSENIYNELDQKVYSDKDLPVVIYAGGLQKWQQVPKMVDAIKTTINYYQYKFFSPEPEKVKALFPEDLVRSNKIEIASKTHDELMEDYQASDFGFILREDIIVNRVACPTKLVEYLAMGVVPIVDCEDIGDFKSLGMKYVKLTDLLNQHLPENETLTRMVKQNYCVFEEIQKLYIQGVSELQRALAINSPVHKRKDIKTWIIDLVKMIFPANTPRGIVLRDMRQWFSRSPYMKISGMRVVQLSQIFPRRVEKIVHEDEPVLPECDILLQVTDFLNGGLERVVLDIAQLLQDEGHKVSLLILGAIGPAADEALQKGIPVYASRYQDDTYKDFLKKISPRIVFSHYSVKGASICANFKIPFVQMIHNIYMWLTEEELFEFQQAAVFTTNYIVTSEASREYSIRKLGVPGQKCLLFPLGIDMQKIFDLDFSKERSRLRKQYSFSDEDFVFLSVAAINHQKNLIGSIKAFHLALEYCSQAKFVLVGPCYERKLLAEIKRYIKNNGLETDIIYVGKVPEAFSYYAMADAFINTSFFEGGPLVLLEAVASGLPIVTTDVGFAGLFKNREGIEIVTPPEDILSFSGSINDLHSSQDFERKFAIKLISIYKNRKKPVLPEDFVKLVDKRKTYEQYLIFINQLVNSSTLSKKAPNKSWMSLL